MRSRKALLVSGGWEGHAPRDAAEEMAPDIKALGFEVTLEESLEPYADEEYLCSFDVIIQNWTMGEILPDELRGLSHAVQKGTGLTGWHGGVVDSFRMATDYLQMVGAQFAAHPGDSVPYTVTFAPEHSEHPIITGLNAFDVTTEQYWMLTDSLNTILAQTVIPKTAEDPWPRPVETPVAWTRQWGKGRIFVNTIGHEVQELRIPEVRAMVLRGISWVARD